MKKSILTMAVTLSVFTLLMGCSSTVDNPTTAEPTELSVPVEETKDDFTEDSEEETVVVAEITEQAEEDESSGTEEVSEESEEDLLTYEMGNLKISLPSYYEVEDSSQTISGMEIRLLQFSTNNNNEIISLSGIDFGADLMKSIEVDTAVESAIQSGLDSMINQIRAQGIIPVIKSQTDTESLTINGLEWSYKNIVIEVGTGTMELDIMINLSPEGYQSSLLLTNLAGNNSTIIENLNEMIYYVE